MDEEHEQEGRGERPSEGTRAASTETDSQGSQGSTFRSELLGRLHARLPQTDRYRVVSEIGRGGMGAVLEVWDEDLGRPLAMKIALTPAEAALATDSSASGSMRLARFLEEAQVTSQLDHPGIVPVHELGLDERGQVYFTMKLVEGQTFKEVIEEVHAGASADAPDPWTLTRAVAALHKVCEAMAYAHEKGVVHRDLKPGNVMVGSFGEVYVMDWGLAHLRAAVARSAAERQPDSGMARGVSSDRAALTDEDPESPLRTLDGDVVGTPAYMPPEQALGQGEEVGPRSDVYAVGAVLYHLLSGRLPYTGDSGAHNHLAIWSRLREGPPEALEGVAPGAPAELVAVCERAMQREADARYPDMLALADDLRRWLEGHVVRAHRTGHAVAVAKWVQRNRATAVFGALVLLLSAVSFVLVSISRVAAEGERAAQEQAAIAQHEAQLRGAVTDFLVQAFDLSDVPGRRPENVTAKELLDRAAERLAEDELPPELELELLAQLGAVYRSMGLLAEAHDVLTQRILALSELQGPDHAQVQLARVELAEVQTEMGRFDSAEQSLGDVLRARERTRGEDSAEALEARLLHGRALLRTGQTDEAESQIGLAAEGLEDLLGDEDELALRARAELLALQSRAGQPDAQEALEALADVQERVLGAAHADTLNTIEVLAECFARRGLWEKSEELLSLCLERRREALGEMHPEVIRNQASLAVSMRAQEKRLEAEQLALLALRNGELALGEDHPTTWNARNQVWGVLIDEGRLDELDPDDVQRVVELESKLGSTHPELLTARIHQTLIGSALESSDGEDWMDELPDMAELEHAVETLAANGEAEADALARGGWALLQEGNLDQARRAFEASNTRPMASAGWGQVSTELALDGQKLMALSAQVEQAAESRYGVIVGADVGESMQAAGRGGGPAPSAAAPPTRGAAPDAGEARELARRTLLLAQTNPDDQRAVQLYVDAYELDDELFRQLVPGHGFHAVRVAARAAQSAPEPQAAELRARAIGWLEELLGEVRERGGGAGLLVQSQLSSLARAPEVHALGEGAGESAETDSLLRELERLARGRGQR